jgi:transposase-like protein
MPSNNSKYTEEFREQTVKHIFERGKSATRMAEEMGIDTNTVCRWVRDYRRKFFCIIEKREDIQKKV